MNYSIKLNTLRCGLFKRYTSKIAVQIESTVLEKLESDELKPRKHPGLTTKSLIQLPEHIRRALKRLIGDYPVKTILRDGRQLNQYILARHPPPEKHELRMRMREIVDEVDQLLPLRSDIEGLSEEEEAQLRHKRNKAIEKLKGQRNYSWRPITYEAYEALVYAITRGAQEFAVLMHILSEVAARDAEFKPRSYFDFGAGVGTGMWAASSLWAAHIYEYYNVDSSRDMNDFSDLILRDGNENQKLTLRNVYYRQFLPAIDTKYDLIVCAYTLFEIAGAQEREKILLNLWRKCDKYLVLVEEGTRRGSELLNEARDFLLAQAENDERLKGHVFAPCPHDAPCPRLANTADNTPCNFELTYKPLDIGDAKVDRIGTRFSYIVLKKGTVTDVTRDWPRLVRPTLLRSKHAVCRLCTADARLQEVIFTQSKHGRIAYRCAKASRWGDRLPMSVGKPFSELQEELIEEQSPKSSSDT